MWHQPLSGQKGFPLAGLMIEHPLVAPHITSIEGSMDGVMGLSKAAFMQTILDAASASSEPMGGQV
jgi:hypothetical protein